MMALLLLLSNDGVHIRNTQINSTALAIVVLVLVLVTLSVLVL